ncbi:hypothetical protein GCM10009799_47470 [Nocardiopsis rhodophaea]|uniref:Secreted protein n=1 Tax=Nocardiopsis rhodophaea TaxID=280238 RepID=A0ABP5F1Y9_9ACTN
MTPEIAGPLILAASAGVGGTLAYLKIRSTYRRTRFRIRRARRYFHPHWVWFDEPLPRRAIRRRR